MSVINNCIYNGENKRQRTANNLDLNWRHSDELRKDLNTDNMILSKVLFGTTGMTLVPMTHESSRCSAACSEDSGIE